MEAASPFTGFRLESEHRGDAMVARLAGDFDLAGCAQVTALLALRERERAGLLVIDLSELTWIDSSALSELLRAQLAAQNEGFRLAIVRPRPALGKMLRVTGADRLLPLVDASPAA